MTEPKTTRLGRLRTTALTVLLAAMMIATGRAPAEAAQDPVPLMLLRVNQARAKLGLSKLSLDARLSRAAQRQSHDLAALGTLTHGGPGGDLAARVLRVGYRFGLIEENLAAGVADPAAVVNLWLRSPGHRANLLRAAVNRAGIGYVARGNGRNGHYWTLIMAQPVN
jgi:uncharacterized protein YkwD